MRYDLKAVLRELEFMFGPAAPAMLLCFIETGDKVKSFVGIDAPWIRDWCELRKIG